MKAIRYYDKPDGWIEYVIVDGKCYGSAHAHNNKYSKSMLRALIKGINEFSPVITELRYNYLLRFYKRHFEVEDIGNNFYILRRK